MKIESKTVTAEMSLTGRTLKVLSVIADIPQTGQGVASRARVNYNTTLGILIALLDLGLVKKERRSGYAWVLTDKGQAVLDQLNKVDEELLAHREYDDVDIEEKEAKQ